MADEKKTDNKKRNIIIAVIVLIIVIIAVWYFWFKTPPGNQYATGATLEKIRKGGYGTWKEWPADTQRDATNAELNKIDGTPAWSGADVAVFPSGAVYGAAWLKGMNIEYSVNNVQNFKADIEKYIKDTKLRKPHWDVSTGAFLNAS